MRAGSYPAGAVNTSPPADKQQQQPLIPSATVHVFQPLAICTSCVFVVRGKKVRGGGSPKDLDGDKEMWEFPFQGIHLSGFVEQTCTQPILAEM